MVISAWEYLQVKYSSLGEMHSSVSLVEHLWGQTSPAAFSYADAREKKQKHSEQVAAIYDFKVSFHMLWMRPGV